MRGQAVNLEALRPLTGVGGGSYCSMVLMVEGGGCVRRTRSLLNCPLECHLMPDIIMSVPYLKP